MTKKTLIQLAVYLIVFSPYIGTADKPTSLQDAINQFLENNIDRSLPVFSMLAKQNNPEAHYYLGLIYSDTVPELFNPKLGLSHFQSAAEQNHALSMYSIGTMYGNGIGVKQDAMVAMDWYRRSKQAEKKINDNITFYKKTNTTLEKVEYKQVFQDLLNKAEDGDPAIQFQVATIYDHGKLVPRDFSTALTWYKKAAHNNYEEAQFMLGYFYCRGIGVEQDKKRADDWLSKSKRLARCSE